MEDSGPAGNDGGAGLGAERGDLAELRAMADADDRDAAWKLAELRASVMDDHRHVHPAGRRAIRGNGALPLITSWPSCGNAARSGGESDALSPIAELLSGELATALVAPAPADSPRLSTPPRVSKSPTVTRPPVSARLKGPGRIPRRTGPGREVTADGQGVRLLGPQRFAP